MGEKQFHQFQRSVMAGVHVPLKKTKTFDPEQSVYADYVYRGKCTTVFANRFGIIQTQLSCGLIHQLHQSLGTILQLASALSSRAGIGASQEIGRNRPILHTLYGGEKNID